MARILISGLARSGTSTLYSSLQHILSQQEEEYKYVYEPYLWVPDIFNDLLQKFTSEFQTTDSLHIDGLYAHCKSPLFLTKPHAIHDEFISNSVFPENRKNVLAKIIRGNGRLVRYLDVVEDLKIILIVRNPLDSINSVMGLFSYFGDEFYPSDKSRFLEEIEERFHHMSRENSITEMAHLFGLWWQYMTQEAMAVAQENPDRVFALPYEAYRDAPAQYMKAITAFCGIEDADLPSQIFQRKAGPVTSTVNLNEVQVRTLSANDQLYWDKIVPQCNMPLSFDIAQIHEETSQRYEGAQGEAVLEQVSPSRTILHLRSEILSMRKQRKFLLQEATKCVRLGRANEIFAQKLSKRVSDDQEIQKIINQLDNSRMLKWLGPLSKRVRNDIEKIRHKINVVYQPADITCIITSFNQVDTLREAVMSVLVQSRPVKSVIIADDGSTDGTRDLANSLENEFESVSTVFRDQNLGPGLNRHLAILQSKTPFITSLDGDDTFGMEKMDHEARALHGSLKAIAFCDIVMDNTDGKSNRLSPEPYAALKSKQERVVATVTRSISLPHNMLMSKHLYLLAGGYDKSAWMYEDWSLKLRLANICDDWRYVSTIGLIYNRHGAGLSGARKCYHAYWLLYCIAQNISWLKDILISNDLGDVMMMIGKFAKALESGTSIDQTASALQRGQIGVIDVELMLRDFIYRIPLKPDIRIIDERFNILGQALARVLEERGDKVVDIA